MKIGYACLIAHNDQFKYQTVKLKTISNETLKKVIKNNLKVLSDMIDYNVNNNIKMFRITSDLIPFGSSKYNSLDWESLFKEEFELIKAKIQKADMRISMHPGQYTVLNSPNSKVVNNSIKDLEYHTKILELLDTTDLAKIILHVGGVYGDKKSAIERFITNYQSLDESIKKRLVIENDDKSYTVDDVLYISSIINLPVVFDNLHNHLNPSLKSEFELLDLCMKTWISKPKMHYSNQDMDKKNGGHSKRIDINLFLEFYNGIIDKNLDIMLEVKDKNVSAIKCQNIINDDINKIEKEWAKYKYLVMEKSHKTYLEIREMMKEQIDAKLFYQKIDNCLDKVSEKDFENALLHVWGYFKNVASENEKTKFFSLKEKNPIRAKEFLRKLSIKYNQEYIINSYYFMSS